MLDYTLSFNSSNICTLVQVIDDRLIESNETFEISIEFENPNDVVNGRNTTTVTIIDDDGKNTGAMKKCFCFPGYTLKQVVVACFN